MFGTARAQDFVAAIFDKTELASIVDHTDLDRNMWTYTNIN